MRTNLTVLSLFLTASCAEPADCRESATCPVPPDAGAEAGEHSATAAFTFDPISQQRVTHDTPLRLRVTIKRQSGTPADVMVRVPAVLPPGVSVDTLTIKATESSGTLIVRAGAGTQQGPFEVTLEGTSGGQTATTSLPLFIRGKPGSVDTTFGTSGSATAIQIGEEPVAIFAGANDQLFVVTSCEEYNRTCVGRLSADGAPDASYGTGIGRLPLRLPMSAALTADGKIVVGGGGPAAVGRLGTDGKPDTALSSTGVLTIVGRASEGEPLGVDAIAFGPGETFYAAFRTDAGYIGFRKYDKSGASGGWGIGGTGYQALRWGTKSTIAGMTARSNGALTFTLGYTGGESGAGVGIGRWTSTGEGLDPAFGTGGYSQHRLGTSSASRNAFAELPDGRVLAAFSDGSLQTFLVQFSADGKGLDKSWGTGGNSPYGAGSSVAFAMAADGKVVIAESWKTPALIGRVGVSGASDPEFGVGGVAGLGVEARAHALAIQSDGRIVVACKKSGGPSATFLVRLWN